MGAREELRTHDDKACSHSRNRRDCGIGVIPSDACTTSPDAESQIAGRIRQTLPWVRSVQIRVGATGRALGQYVRTSCATLSLPGGTGRVVLTQSGSNMATTRTFTVHLRRWTIEYVNNGRLLQIFPMKRGNPTIGTFIVKTRSAGKHVMSGAGTYSLQVTGFGRWEIRVRDGA